MNSGAWDREQLVLLLLDTSVGKKVLGRFYTQRNDRKNPGKLSKAFQALGWNRGDG